MDRKNEIKKILENYIFQNNFDEEMQHIFIKQINRFLNLKELPKEDFTFKLDKLGNVILNEGMLIHGTFYNKEVLQSIHRSGIITGQARNIYEDCETYNCADFWRVKNDISLKEYDETFPSNDSRTPFGHQSNSVAFVLDIPVSMEELASYDCYRETENGKKTLKFVNQKGLPTYSHEILSSIIYGLPQNCIQGIILGDRLLQKPECLEFIINEFKDIYILTTSGFVLSDPHKTLDHDDILEKLENHLLIHTLHEHIINLIQTINNTVLSINKLFEYIGAKGLNINMDNYILDKFAVETKNNIELELQPSILSEKSKYYENSLEILEKMKLELVKQIIQESNDYDLEKMTIHLRNQLSLEDILECIKNDDTFVIESLVFEAGNQK